MLAALFLSPLFSDHMVLQQKRCNPIWGKDQPGQRVLLEVEGGLPTPVQVEVQTAADGTWRLQCPELPAGGPYRVHVRGSTEKVIEDVLVGEVWLASGQSNMEFELEKAEGARAEIETAQHPGLRVFHQERRASLYPQTEAQGSWRVCTPQTAGAFTAVGYFFARELQKVLGVPVGLVSASWGGTPIESWTSVEGLRSSLASDALLASLREQEGRIEQIREEYWNRLQAWDKEHLAYDSDNRGAREGWASPEHPDRDWQPFQAPGRWNDLGEAFLGAVWFRKEIDLPPEAEGKKLELRLGSIWETDTVYFNGEKVGETQLAIGHPEWSWRVYTVPAALVKKGRALIAVRAFDRLANGGLHGPDYEMRVLGDGLTPIPLKGTWKYKVEVRSPIPTAEVYAARPPQPQILEKQYCPTALYNGMIAPFVAYGLQGVLWYQGESNAADYTHYRHRFPMMIRDWRTKWGQGAFGFYFVQLANWKAGGDWAFQREAQMAALAEPHTGFAVTLDIGDPFDIHPIKKREVGQRLASAALAQTYGKVEFSPRGPHLLGYAIEAGSVQVRFYQAQGLRTRDGSTAVKGFALAGEDGVYHPAEAHLEGETVRLHCPLVPEPKSIRYAFADTPETNLENAAGLPAEPFRTDAQAYRP